MNTLTRKLIAQEVIANRWMLVSGTLAALLAVALAGTSRMGFSIGLVVWMTALIAGGIMFVIFGVINQRKENSLLFLLSLPMSPRDYVRSKQLGLIACFLPMWALSSAAALTLVLAHPGVPDGLAPFTTLLSVFMLANYMIVVTGALHVKSEGLFTAVIVVTNTLASLFTFSIISLPGIGAHAWSAAPAWNSTFMTVLAVELGILILAFAHTYFVTARRRNFL